MATKLGIVNSALLKLGARTISSLNDSSKTARLANETFDGIRDLVLQSHEWNFAMKRESVASDVTGPEWGFDFAYSVPIDCFKVISINGEDLNSCKWKVEGRKIVTDLTSPVEILFIFRAEDYGDYPPLFSDALAERCAAEWCQRVTGTDSTQQIHVNLSNRKINEAKSVDGQEGTPKKIGAGAWIESRWGGRPGF